MCKMQSGRGKGYAKIESICDIEIPPFKHYKGQRKHYGSLIHDPYASTI